MKLGEVSPGGVGVGLNGMLVLALLAVFIAGLMVGRTPEYLGKKIQAAEMKLVVLYILAMPLVVLGFAAGIAIVVRLGARRVDLQPRPARLHRGALRLHVGGEQQRLGVRRPHRRTPTGINTTLGHRDADRPVLPDHPGAGHRRLARAQADRCPPTAGTFPTAHAAVRRLLVVGVIVIVAGLTFFPALALGPIVEQLGI